MDEKRKRRQQQQQQQQVWVQEEHLLSGTSSATKSCLSLPSHTGYGGGGGSSAGSSRSRFSPLSAFSRTPAAPAGSTLASQRVRPSQQAPSSTFRIPEGGPKSEKQNEKKLLKAAMDDTMLAEELNQLSLQEREVALAELHGVAEVPPEEAPELMAALLAKLLEEIRKLPNKNKQRRALDRALWLRPSLLQDKDFLIMFLRADRYDPARAARRLSKHFHYKLELFGDARLARHITIDDLNEDDMDVFRTGFFEILSKKDTAGRSVAVCILRLMKYKHWTNVARYLWYVRMDLLLGNVDAQIRGVVDIVYCQLDPQEDSSAYNSWIQSLANGGDALSNALPGRWTGLHVCYDSPRLQPLVGILQMVIGRETRSRCRTHFGSYIEIHYVLMTFGIPVSALPISNDGVYSDKSILKSIAMHRSKPPRESRWMNENASSGKDDGFAEVDSSSERARMALYPSPNDVLIGRGRSYQEFHGNQRLNQKVDEYRERYFRVTDRLDKTFIVMEVVQLIEETGGYFLQRKEDGWEAVDDAMIRAKVSHAFRRPDVGASRIFSRPVVAVVPDSRLQSEDVLAGDEDVLVQLLTNATPSIYTKRTRYVLDEDTENVYF